MITIQANAKINLSLEVLGKRDDGFHRIASVMQEISLSDTVEFDEADEIELECSIPELNSSRNLVHVAAGVLRGFAGSSRGASIRLNKRIPMAAGLGGGSSDAVSTLKALIDLWGLELSPEQLLDLAQRLGSDTAFFVHGGTALVEGRGELVTPLSSLPATWVVIAVPPINVPQNKTKAMYAALRPPHFSDGRRTRELADSLAEHGDISFDSLPNAFESVAFEVYRRLDIYWQRLVDLGADNVHLAGSGPALFSLSRDRVSAKLLYDSTKSEGMESYLVQTVEQL